MRRFSLVTEGPDHSLSVRHCRVGGLSYEPNERERTPPWEADQPDRSFLPGPVGGLGVSCGLTGRAGPRGGQRPRTSLTAHGVSVRDNYR